MLEESVHVVRQVAELVVSGDYNVEGLRQGLGVVGGYGLVYLLVGEVVFAVANVVEAVLDHDAYPLSAFLITRL